MQLNFGLLLLFCHQKCPSPTKNEKGKELNIIRSFGSKFIYVLSLLFPVSPFASSPLKHGG
jgi:hypothetical protein